MGRRGRGHSTGHREMELCEPVPPEDCRGNIVGLEVAQEKSMKQEGRGQGTTFERMT